MKKDMARKQSSTGKKNKRKKRVPWCSGIVGGHQ
jgi:hypothetical protein